MSEPQGYTQAVVDILNSKLGQSITQAFTAGEEQERERIINLLEDLDCEKNGNPNHDTHDCLYYQTADSLIALIKGEGENPKDNESVSLLPEEEN
ncbi:hypothetical protein UFOVP45_101 [uncultured Caudovirales phage]|uniref:Uncharacterized protein n=1 Tax=uncultured Caudovirales phage TaxID=2100421 RepID=A0A6J5KVC2_9CAUD|nr:hypothetical protein UFOVP45_101 [uncultured Caudovirales phage]